MYEYRNPALHDLYHGIGWWLRRFLIWIRSRRAAEWIRTDAVIRSALARQVDPDRYSGSSRQTEWRPVVRYEYQVENTTYSGKAKGEIWYFDDEGAADTARSLIGATLPIRYDPSRPSMSVYIPADGGPPQFLPANPDPQSGLITISLE